MKIEIDNKLIESLQKCCKRNGSSIPKTNADIAKNISVIVADYIYDLNHAKEVEEIIKEDVENDVITYNDEEGDLKDIVGKI